MTFYSLDGTNNAVWSHVFNCIHTDIATCELNFILVHGSSNRAPDTRSSLATSNRQIKFNEASDYLVVVTHYPRGLVHARLLSSLPLFPPLGLSFWSLISFHSIASSALFRYFNSFMPLPNRDSTHEASSMLEFGAAIWKNYP